MEHAGVCWLTAVLTYKGELTCTSLPHWPPEYHWRLTHGRCITFTRL